MQHLSRALHRISETKNSPSFLPQSVQHIIEEPPSRLSVDPGAMAIACAVRAGQAAQAEGQAELAAELFGFVLSKGLDPQYAYYVVQAKLGIAEISRMTDRPKAEEGIKVSAY
jgi:hypothetical protein